MQNCEMVTILMLEAISGEGIEGLIVKNAGGGFGKGAAGVLLHGGNNNSITGSSANTLEAVVVE